MLIVAKKSAGFIDLHAEKLVLGLSALLVIGATIYSLGGGRFAVNDRKPADLIQQLGDAAEQTRQAILSARPTEDKAEKQNPARDPVALLQKWYGDESSGLTTIAELPSDLPRTQPFPPPYVPVGEASGGKTRQLAALVNPDIPIAIIDDKELLLLPEKPEIEQYDGRPPSPLGAIKVKKKYVSIAAQVDLLNQDANFRAENYPPASYLEIVSVQLQRKDLNDPRRGWENVETYLPFKPFARPRLIERGGGSFKFDGLDTFRQKIVDGAEAIARPKLPSASAELPPLPYLDEPPKRPGLLSPSDAEREAGKRVEQWTARAKSALAGRRPFGDPDLDAAYILARAAAWTLGAPDRAVEAAKKLLDEIVDKMPRDRRAILQAIPRTPEKMMPIVAHDLSVEPGHTYVYRMRFEAYNVYAGNPGELASAADARRLTFFSGWSPVSRPVEITGDTYFYLTKADKKRGDVTVTVFKVGRRGTEKKDYRVRIGDPIGRKERRAGQGDFSTGAVCMDIDFARALDGKSDVSMVFMDPVDGILRERILSVDRKDKVYRRLNEQRSAAGR